ncbi:hypothetical protein F5B18DRAFT_644514 [Nemania serpens]|nr:hypothetical protein F5B18DRAFT_644514 [Nemania serpens]
MREPFVAKLECFCLLSRAAVLARYANTDVPRGVIGVLMDNHEMMKSDEDCETCKTSNDLTSASGEAILSPLIAIPAG